VYENWPSADNIDDLSALTSVGSLTIRNNDALTDIDGLAALANATSIDLTNNLNLANIDGLNGLTLVDQLVLISGNPTLANIDGLSALVEVGPSCTNCGIAIVSNDALTNVDGLSGITKVDDILIITFNDQLTNLAGLSAVNSVGRLSIANNLSLCQQSVDDLLSQITYGLLEGAGVGVGGNTGLCEPACGDGNVDPGELCDDGNTSDGDCCSSTCAIEPADTVCGPVADICDIEEVCDGTSSTCPADERLPDTDTDGTCDAYDICPDDPDPSQADTDEDGLGDACDLCNGGATTTRQIVKVTNFATYDDSSPAGAFLERGGLPAAEEGDDKLTFKATLQFDAPVFPDPEDNGFALTLADATGKILLDLQIPPGAYNAIGRSGWISSQKRLRFVTRTPVGGLVPKVILKSKPKDPSQVVVIVKGKKGNFADPDITLPLKATVSLDPTDAMTSLCAEAEFPGPKPLPYCRMSGNGVAVTCK